MIKLIIEDDEGKTTIVPLIRDEITIGRKEGNTIRLTERNVSRRHAKLVKQNGKVYVEDLGSYNGIFVNGTRISGRVPVAEGDKIQIGDYILALKYDAPAAAPKPDPFEEMKTIPLERTQQPEPATPPVPAPAPGGQPAVAQAPAQAAPAPAQAAQAAQVSSDAVTAPQAAPAPEPQPAGKLVVVSEHMFGTEFVLDRPTMVIGRLPENDIVLDHKSISRHHAKVVREGTHYVIIDLGSQNGVIVNGEQYDKVQLRKGDMVDLGHIRLRFVAPGEEYHPVRSARELPAVKSKLGLVAAVAAVVVAVIVVYFVAFHKSSKKSKPNTATIAPTRPAVATVADAGTAESPETIDYSLVQSALQAQDWEKAEVEAKKVLSAHPGDKTAKVLLDKARTEKRNQARFRAFKHAWEAGKVAKAVDLGKNFPEQSVYHKDVQALWPQVVGEYVNQLVAKAQNYVRRNRCTEAKILARKALALKPDETRFQPLLDQCGGTGQVAQRTPRTRKSRPASPRPEDIGTRPVRPAGQDKAAQAKALVAEARKLWLTNQCSQAIRIARKAYRLRPSSSAAMIIGTCSCNLHRRRDAQWAYRHIHSQAKKNLLVKVCRSKGINLQ